jgi:hypothetical protein
LEERRKGESAMPVRMGCVCFLISCIATWQLYFNGRTSFQRGAELKNIFYFVAAKMEAFFPSVPMLVASCPLSNWCFPE